MVSDGGTFEGSWKEIGLAEGKEVANGEAVFFTDLEFGFRTGATGVGEEPAGEKIGDSLS